MASPIHVAIIPDGNRRYAKEHNLDLLEAYKHGAKTIEMVINHLLEKGVKYVTVYGLSAENLNRDKEELEIIFSVLRFTFQEFLQDKSFSIPNIKFIGRIAILPDDLQRICKEVESATKNKDDARQIFIGIAYGGRQEIIDAVINYIDDELDMFLEKPVETIIDKLEKIASLNIDETRFSRYLYVDYTKVPYPDMVIRTGGAHRISNFLLYPAAYSEWYFVDKLWGDITKEDIDEALEWYSKQKRNFGK